MNTRSTRAFAAMLLVGVVAVSTTGLVSPALAAAAGLKITDKAVGEPMQDAQKAAASGQYKEAVDDLKKAEAASKDRATTVVIHTMMLAYALQGKDNAVAAALVDRMLAAGEGDKQKNLQAGLNLALQMKNTAKAAEYQKQLGGNSAIYVAQAYFQGGDYKAALATAKPLLQNGTPSQDLLQLLAAIYGKTGDDAGRRATQEQLVLNYPKGDYWHDLIRMAHNEKGLSDEQDYELYRLRFAVGDMKTVDDFTEMAQIGVQLGYPAEAKMVLDKAASMKLLSGADAARSQRLVDFVNKALATDEAALPNLTKQAATDATGMTYVKLGSAYSTRGKYKEAEDAYRQGIMKGMLKDPEMAKIQLGHALLGDKKAADAASQFNAVPKTSKDYSVARLWWIYAQHG